MESKIAVSFRASGGHDTVIWCTPSRVKRKMFNPLDTRWLISGMIFHRHRSPCCWDCYCICRVSGLLCNHCEIRILCSFLISYKTIYLLIIWIIASWIPKCVIILEVGIMAIILYTWMAFFKFLGGTSVFVIILFFRDWCPRPFDKLSVIILSGIIYSKEQHQPGKTVNDRPPNYGNEGFIFSISKITQEAHRWPAEKIAEEYNDDSNYCFQREAQGMSFIFFAQSLTTTLQYPQICFIKQQILLFTISY